MTGPTIRTARPDDTAAVYDVCLRTGDHGADASGRHDDPDLFGHVWAGPYLALEPEHALVIEDADGVAGYVLGALDSRAFEQACDQRWWPTLRRRVADPPGAPSTWTPDQRLASQQRGHWSAAALLDAASRAGHASLGWPDAGVIDTGAVADLVAVRLDSVRTAGGADADALERVVFAGTAADVTDVVVSGRRVVAGGEHLLLGDVGALLDRAVAALL